MRLGRHLFWLAAISFFGIFPAQAAGLPEKGGEILPLLWALPFAGMLCSIALLPLISSHFWHAHYGKASAFWTLCFLAPCLSVFGSDATVTLVMHSLIHEFIPFMIILIALYPVAGGIYVQGNLRSSAAVNTAILGTGALLASAIGTTGASMALIRPLIRANDARPHNAHVIVFFIILVSNIGGALTPLGDPPLFIGYLRGVDFFWPTLHLLAPMLTCVAILLAVFFATDSYFFRRDGIMQPDPTPDTRGLRVIGGINFFLMGCIIVSILVAPSLQLGGIDLHGVHLPWNAVLRDALLLLIAALSLKFTPVATRHANSFSWAPVQEVAILFIAIFITAAPVLAMLRQGDAGALHMLTQAVTQADGAPHPLSYFWLTGVLSAFLDNAPTYLVFFEMAGGDAKSLMGPLQATLIAISCGAVFMGALSYIGNAPNFMIRAIAENHGIKMPSFFAYMAWASLILLPVFVLISALFFS